MVHQIQIKSVKKRGTNMDLNLDLNLSLSYEPKRISEVLMEVSATTESSKKFSMVDQYVKGLEDEMKKLDGFKRELPLAFSLIEDAIIRLKEEAKYWNWRNLVNENGDGGAISETKDRGSLMSSALFSSSKHEFDQNGGEEKDGNPMMKRGGSFDSIIGLDSYNGASKVGYNGKDGSVVNFRGQTRIKQRRCWSDELHRQFVDALQQLGGSRVATPKQIKELMQVDGLTNDEVKSHLQKYRLHVRDPSFLMNRMSSEINLSHSGSPPALVNASGSGKSSCGAEEEEKSDGHS